MNSRLLWSAAIWHFVVAALLLIVCCLNGCGADRCADICRPRGYKYENNQCGETCTCLPDATDGGAK